MERESLDLSRREFMAVGTTSMLSLPDGELQQIKPQLQGGETATGETDFAGVADLLGPADARPAPGSAFFEDKVFNGYRYEETDTGDRWFITNPYNEWIPLMTNPETQVDEVRVEDYTSFFNHTFARPEAPDDKNWVYTDADVTKFESEIELASTTVVETTQHGNYPPGTESVAGWAFRLTGTPTAGDAYAGYFNDQNGFGTGEDATDSYAFLRKAGTTTKVYRENWNGDYVPDSRLWVGDDPIITRSPHLFYGGGAIPLRAMIHDNGDTRLRTLHTFTPDNTPDTWGEGPPFDQPNLPITFESDGLTGGALRANAAHYERGQSDAEQRVNGEHIAGVTVPTDDWVPLLSWQKRTGWEMVNVKPLGVTVSATSNDLKLELQLDPTLDGTEVFSLATHTSSDETAVEVTENGNQGSITTDGERRWSGYASAGANNKGGDPTGADLQFNLPNNQIVTLAAQAVGNNATASGAVTWAEFF